VEHLVMTDPSVSEVPTKAPNKGGRPKGKKDDPRIQRDRKTAKIIELAAKNVQVSDIAEAVALPINTVKNTLAKFLPLFKELENVPDFRTVKSDILSAGQLAVLKSALSQKKVEKAGFLSLVQGAEILNKMERLDQGKSTDNISHNVFGKLDISRQLTSDKCTTNTATTVENAEIISEQSE
jgi:hypothetical protein